MKTAILFPGQGAQAVGMGADLYDNNFIYKQTFDICSEGAGLDLKGACFEGKMMEDSEVVQPAIFAHSISLFKTLQNEVFDADIYAGLSLGEYSALTAAGVFGVAQCASIVRKRGRIMDEAFPKGEGGMLSVIGFTVEQIEVTIADYKEVYVANHLSEQQIVIAGRMGDLLALKGMFEQKGAKMVSLLSVRGPSHAPLLSGAAELFAKILEAENVGAVQKTVYSNALGAPYRKDSDVKQLLAQQMYSRVKWYDCIEGMISSRVERYIEVGPSNVLSKMLKRRVDKSIEVESVRDLQTFQKFLDDNTLGRE